MKKSVIIGLLLAIFASLYSCVGGDRPLRGTLSTGETDDEIAEAQFMQVLDAIENKDKEALRSVFSETALKNAEDFDSRMDYLFNFVQGNVTTWRSQGNHAVGMKSAGRTVEYKLTYNYSVITDEDYYTFFFVDYPVDYENPENAGLYMLQVVKLVGDHECDGGNDMLCAGIYKPGTIFLDYLPYKKEILSPSGKYRAVMQESRDGDGYRHFQPIIQATSGGEAEYVCDTKYIEPHKCYVLWSDKEDELWAYSHDTGIIYWSRNGGTWEKHVWAEAWGDGREKTEEAKTSPEVPKALREKLINLVQSIDY